MRHAEPRETDWRACSARQWSNSADRRYWVCRFRSARRCI